MVLAGLPNPTFGSDIYKQKQLMDWDSVDVHDWLNGKLLAVDWTKNLNILGLNLSEYAHSFFANNVCGSDLMSFNRASFIQLNVTRVAHRKTIEDSIRDHTANK